ncbi:hypothetical protein ACVMB2_000411 [Sinorhizobium meliloti]
MTLPVAMTSIPSSGRNFSRAKVVFQTTASMRARSSFRAK